jgi:hypothetical protein
MYIPKDNEINKMVIKYTKWAWNIPYDYKICKHFPFQGTQEIHKFRFLVRKWTIWQLWADDVDGWQDFKIKITKFFKCFLSLKIFLEGQLTFFKFVGTIAMPISEVKKITPLHPIFWLGFEPRIVCPVFNFTTRNEILPPGRSWLPGWKFVPYVWSYPLGWKQSVQVNEGVNIPPTGQSSAPRANFTPRGKFMLLKLASALARRCCGYSLSLSLKVFYWQICTYVCVKRIQKYDVMRWSSTYSQTSNALKQ